MSPIAEAIFNIQADIIPVLDEKALQVHAQVIAKQFNNILTKTIKPVEITPDPKNFAVAQTFASRIISQLKILNRDTGTLNKSLTTTANIFSLAAENAVGLVRRGIQPLVAGIERLAPTATRVFGIIRSVGAGAFDVARAGALQLANAINLTNTNILGFAGNIRKAIQENRRFKDALEGIVRVGGAIRDLPKAFQNLQASVIAGVSPLQRAADAGDGLARSLVPFLIIGTTVVREISKISEQFRTMIFDINGVSGALVPMAQRIQDAIGAFGKEAPTAEAAINRLKAAVPGLSSELDKLLLKTRGQGVKEFSNNLAGLREEFIKTELRGTGLVGVIKRLFAGQFSAQTEAAKTDLREINRLIIATGDKKDVPFFSRLAIQAEDAFAKIKRGVESITPQLRTIVFTAALETSQVVQQVKTRSKELGDLFRQGFEEASTKAGGAGLKAKFAGILGGLSKASEGEAGKLGTGFFNRFFKSGEKVAGGGGGLFSKLAGGAEGASSKLGALKNTISGLIGSAGGLGDALGPLAGVAGLGGIAIAALNAAAKMETLKTALAGIFGSEAAAGFKQIEAFAAKTPFTVETATNSVIKLGAAFEGLSIPGGLAITQQIAGAAAAIGAGDDAINRVVLGFTQIQAAGKLTADNLRQITEALPNVSKVSVYNALAKQLGVTNEEAKRLANEGLIDATQGAEALLQAFHDAPGAAGALEKQSQTFTGLMSTAKDTVTQFLAALGGPLLAAAKPILKLIIGFFTLAIGYITLVSNGIKVLIEAFNNLEGVKKFFENLKNGFDEVQQKIQAFIGAINKIPFLKSAIDKVAGAFEGAGNKGKKAGEDISDGLQLALDSVDPVKRALAAVIQASDPKKIIENFENLRDAQKDAAAKLVTSEIAVIEKALSLKSAFDSQKAAAKGVTEAQNRLTEAIAEHNKEIADKTLKLEKDLADAREKTAETNNKQAEAQQKLTEALKGADTEELEKGDLALASAKLRLRQLIEDEKKAQDELNETQQVGIDLTGLSLDQVKSRLRTVRASLAAQKSVKKAEETKTPEQKEIDTLTAGITRRQAELDILDATKAVAELRKQGTELDPVVIAARQAILAAQKATEESIAKEQEIQVEINKLHGPDLEFQKEKAGLQADITAAQRAQREAAEDTQLAVAKAKDDNEAILKILGDRINREPELKAVLLATNVPLDVARDLSSKIGGEFDVTKGKVEVAKSEVDKLNEALTKSIEIAKQFGLDTTTLELQRAIEEAKQGKAIDPKIKAFVNKNIFDDPKNLNLISQILGQFLTKALEKGATTTIDPDAAVNKKVREVALIAAQAAISSGLSDFEEVKKLVIEALRQIPGFNNVQLAQGALVERATSATLGEAGREVVLPLTRPARLQDLLANKKVLPPILAALQKITLPGIKATTMDQVRLSPASLPLEGVRRVRSSSQNPNAQEQSKRDKQFAKAIVSEMKEAGIMSSGGNTITNHFDTPDDNDPLSRIKLNQIAREVKRQIEKSW